MEDVVRLAGITWWSFYFRLFPGSIRSPQVVEFLAHLQRHLPGKLLVVWNGLKSQGSRVVWDFVRQQRGRIGLEFLPAYAPELNPGRVSVVAAEAARAPELLPQGFWPTESLRPEGTVADAPAAYSGNGLRGTG